MPNCFQLTDKVTKEHPILQQVDDSMREYFGAPPSSDEWYLGWMDTVGLGLSLGHSFTKLKVFFEGTRLIPVIDWLESRYTADSWAEFK